MYRTIVVSASGINIGAIPDEQTRTSGVTAVHGQVQGGVAKLVGCIHVRLFGNKLFQAFLMPLDRRDMDRSLRPGFRVHGEITAPAGEEKAREEEDCMDFKEDHNHMR
jgi:hypothetical protein